MEIKKLIPETELYFEYNNKITKGIFKDIQRTNAGKLVKNRNRLVEIVNKKGNRAIINVPKETKFFDSEKALIDFKEQQEKEIIGKQNLAKKKYLENIEKLKVDLNEIENINHLPLFCEIKTDNYDYYYDLFADNYNFKLKDDTNIKMTKWEYRCILHNSSELGGIDIYEIENGQLFMCFDCGELLVSRNDLINQYASKNCLEENIEENILFSKSWTEEGIISWVKKHFN